MYMGSNVGTHGFKEEDVKGDPFRVLNIKDQYCVLYRQGVTGYIQYGDRERQLLELG